MGGYRCTTDSDAWKAVEAATETDRRCGGFVMDDSKPAVIITSERYEEMWHAILAKCEELQRQPGLKPSMRSTGSTSGDGRHMSAICKLDHGDGTDFVYHVEAHVLPHQAAIKVSVDGPWLDSHDGFWTEQAADRRGAVVIGHTHYRIRPDNTPGKSEYAGYGGRMHRIRWLATGETFETRNLWYQGVIPPSWRDRLPDDAEFVKGSAA